MDILLYGIIQMEACLRYYDYYDCLILDINFQSLSFDCPVVYFASRRHGSNPALLLVTTDDEKRSKNILIDLN